MSEDKRPWNQIEIPQDGSTRARLVSGDSHWPFFWAVSTENTCSLALEHNQTFIPKVPKLSSLHLSNEVLDNSSKYLMVNLTDLESMEVFYDFCIDLMSSAEEKTSEAEAFLSVYENLGRWHRLLRGERNSLSPIQVQGLFAEIVVLIEFIKVDPRLAIESWMGPFGSAQDFQFKNSAVEVKSTTGVDNLSVEISSEFQLDIGTYSNIYLLCLCLTLDKVAGRTLSSVVSEVLELLDGMTDLVTSFLFHLRAAGVQKIGDYDDLSWSVNEQMIFEITEDFPRLEHSRIPQAISGVTYRLDLQDCSSWRRPLTDIIEGMD